MPSNLVRTILILLSALFLTSCGPRSLNDFRHEGQKKIKEITAQLRDIHTRTDLMKAAPELTEKFNEIVELMIAAREYSQKYPQEKLPDPTPEEHAASAALRDELNRLAQLDGGREVLVRIQEPSLHRLDAYEKK